MIEIDFKYYFSIFRKRFPIFFLIWVLFTVLAVVIAMVLPSVYRSQATILVESPNITLVEGTVSTPAAEQIQKIETLLMTRPTLLEISDQFDIYTPADGLSPTEIVDEMRDATEFRQVAFSGQRRDGPTTVAFTVSFLSESPVTAARVAGELMTRILERNVEDRKGKAIETYEYFKQERARLLNQLTDLETQIVNLKNENSESLPERLQFNQMEMSRTQERLIQMDRQQLALQEQKEQLQRIIENPLLAAQAGVQQTPQQRELEQLTLELAQKSTIYSETNPQIVQLKSRIAALQEIIGGSDGGDDSSEAVLSPLREQIRQIDNQLALLAQQRATAEAEIDRLKNAIDQTPNVENQLNILTREHATTERQYQDNEGKLAVAASGQTLEIQQQGERFTVVEQPQIPDEPESPNRVLIAVGGFAFGLVAGLAMIVLLELLNTSVRRPADLVRGLGIQPFATIPYIATRREILRRRIRTAVGALAVMTAVPAAVFLVHLYVMPVDLLIETVLDKLGLAGLKTYIS